MSEEQYTPNWPTAYSKLTASGRYRVKDEDFQVTELTNRQLKQEGGHLYLLIEKQGTNTHWLARKLSNHAQCNLKDVGYAGLKDRHAVTRQWFSVPLKNGKAPDLSHLFESDEFTLLAQGFYGAKLKRGALGGNRFRLVIRDIEGSEAELNQRLDLIKQRGVPNYFGPQRFGHDYENLKQAAQLFKSGKRPRNRQKASMYYSAARSYLFNEMLKQRIENQQWDIPVEGEVYGFAGSLRGFKRENTAEETQRWREQETHPTVAMWGKGEALSEGLLSELENNVAQAHPLFAEGLFKQGMKQERRATRMLIPDLFWQWSEDEEQSGKRNLVLHFSLPSGYYATSLLRELGDFTEAERSTEWMDRKQSEGSGEVKHDEHTAK